MGWDESVVPDPQDPETFRRSVLRWEEKDAGTHARMLALYRDLLALRRQRPELTDPDFHHIAATADADARWFRLERGGTEVIVNFSAAVLHLPVSGPRRILLSTDPGAEAVPDALVLPPRSALVVTTGTD